MTELQTLLKETLARWEADTHQHFAEQEAQITELRQQLEFLQHRQSFYEQHLQRLSDASNSLQPLLTRLNSMLSGR